LDYLVAALDRLKGMGGSDDPAANDDNLHGWHSPLPA